MTRPGMGVTHLASYEARYTVVSAPKHLIDYGLNDGKGTLPFCYIRCAFMFHHCHWIQVLY